MPLSLDELLESPDVGLPAVTLPVCIAGHLTAEIADVDQQIQTLIRDSRLAGNDYTPTDDEHLLQYRGRLRYVTTDVLDQLRQLDDRHTELIEKMRVNTVLVGIPHQMGMDWFHWAGDNPPRRDDPVDHEHGCDLAALLDAVDDDPRAWIATLNGEDDWTDEQWDRVWGACTAGDRLRIASATARLHTSSIAPPTSQLRLEALAKTGA